MIQPAQEPIETTRDIASMASDLEITEGVTIKTKLTNERKFEIIKEVCLKYYGVGWNDINSTGRQREKVFIRQVIMCLAVENTSLPLKAIGANFIGGKDGKKDHSTVIHARNTIADLVDSDKKINQDYYNLVEIIQENFKLKS